MKAEQRTDDSGKPRQPVIVNVDLNIPDEDKRENRTYQKRNLRIQIALTVGTWLAVIAAAIYAGIAHRQSDTMNETYKKVKTQTDLMQTEVEGSMAAIVTNDFRATWQDRTYVSVIMANRGRTDASNIHGDIRVTKILLPSEEAAESAIPEWEFDIPELDASPDTQAVRGINLTMSPKDLEASSDMREAIKLTGQITYSNGFRSKSVSVCYYILGPLEFKNKSGAVSQTNGGERATCDDFPRLMADNLKIKRDMRSK